MRATSKAFLIVLCSIISTLVGVTFAQEKPTSPVQSELIGTWLAIVENDTRPRTLAITNVLHKSANVFSLEAAFGYSDTTLSSAEGEISETVTQRKLVLTAKSGAKVTATQVSRGMFSGTFVYRDGTTKAISLEKLSVDEFRARVEASGKGPDIKKPAADVPAQCAAFGGKWTGSWGYGAGQRWIWISEVEANCMAKVAYLFNSWPPTRFEAVEIKQDKLSFTCGDVHCVFEHHGDELWGRATTAEGVNTITLKRIQ